MYTYTAHALCWHVIHLRCRATVGGHYAPQVGASTLPVHVYPLSPGRLSAPEDRRGRVHQQPFHALHCYKPRVERHPTRLCALPSSVLPLAGATLHPRCPRERRQRNVKGGRKERLYERCHNSSIASCRAILVELLPLRLALSGGPFAPNVDVY